MSNDFSQYLSWLLLAHVLKKVKVGAMADYLSLDSTWMIFLAMYSSLNLVRPISFFSLTITFKHEYISLANSLDIILKELKASLTKRYFSSLTSFVPFTIEKWLFAECPDLRHDQYLGHSANRWFAECDTKHPQQTKDTRQTYALPSVDLLNADRTLGKVWVRATACTGC